jgi:hypothetical protein
MITGNESAMPLSNDSMKSGSEKARCLTIRQHFASMAMQGMLANGDGDFVSHHAARIAANAVTHADALIEELNK